LWWEGGGWILCQKLLSDARIGDQRRDKASAKYDADSVCRDRSRRNLGRARRRSRVMT
jgi:hypothetical protein